MVELLFSLGLVTIVVLLLMGVAVTSLRARQKARDTEVAQQVAAGELQRVIDSATVDQPTGYRSKVFDHVGATPVEAGTQLVGETTFSYAIYATILPGTMAPNRLCYIRVSVWWWGGQDQAREGMGRLTYEVGRLLDEPNAAP